MIRLTEITSRATARALAQAKGHIKERPIRYYFIDEDGVIIRTPYELKTKASVQKGLNYIRRELDYGEAIDYDKKAGNPNPRNYWFKGPIEKLAVIDSKTGEIFRANLSFTGFTSTGKKWAKKLGIKI